MINFRYHLVSLISVFLALAIGIVLGAGFLNGATSKLLSDQVKSLTQQKSTLQNQMLDAKQTNGYLSGLTGAVATESVAGLLSGENITVVTLGTGADVNSSESLIKAAGGNVINIINLPDKWWQASAKDQRSTTANAVKPFLENPPTSNATDVDVLAESLAESMTLTVGASTRATLASKLTSSGFVPGLHAGNMSDAVVFIIGDDLARLNKTADSTWSAQNAAALAIAIQTSATLNAVIAGPADSGSDILGVIRANPQVKNNASTVDTPDGETGAFIIVRALAAQQAGTHGSYGPIASGHGSNAKNLLPSLPPTPTSTATPTGGVTPASPGASPSAGKTN